MAVELGADDRCRGIRMLLGVPENEHSCLTVIVDEDDGGLATGLLLDLWHQV
jgi:hypothetical protein